MIFQCKAFSTFRTHINRTCPHRSGFGRKSVVDHLIAEGSSVHARDDGGLIPLHNAASFGHSDVVRALLQAGSPANALDNWNYTPLHEAAIKGKVEVCIG